MKKALYAVVFAVLLVATTFFLAVVPSLAFAESDTNADTSYKETDEYKFLADFVTNHPVRAEDVRLGSELAAAEYLKTQFEQLSSGILGDDASKFSCQLMNFDANGLMRANVVATLQANDAVNQIIIGAHYDSDGGEGANDNASGITALYFTMQRLLNSYNDLKVNVVFIAFGAEEQGMIGSNHYVASMLEMDKDRTLVMFNFDVIANGDNLYLFAENKRTALADFVLSCSSGSVKITEKPYAYGTYPIISNGFGYYETIQNTDFAPFRLAGIPTVAYYSGNYRLWDYVESTDASKRTMNTDGDTLDNLNRNGAVFVERIKSVVASVSQTVLDDGFMEVALNARNQLANNDLLSSIWWPRLIVLAVAAILFAFALWHLRKLQKNAILGTAEVKRTTVFNSPDAEDVFSFQNDQGRPHKNKNDDIDDIFTFKK